MKNNNYKSILYFILIFGALIFTHKYVIDESPIYTFDYSGYFEQFKSYGLMFENSIGYFWNSMSNSIQTSDYNGSSIIPLLPFYFLFGTSRLSYISSMIIIYLMPLIFIIELITKKIFITENKEYMKDRLFHCFVLLYIFFYTRLWSSTLRGMTDISGLLFSAISYLIVLYKPRDKKKNKLWMILLGINIYLPFLLRRWYAYFVVSFLISLFIFDLIKYLKPVIKKRKFDKELFLIYFINYVIVGLTIIICGIICQLPLIKRIIGEDYSDLYSTYQISFLGHLKSFYNEFGLMIIVLLIVSLVLSIWKRKYLKSNLFCFSNFIIFWILFTKVQLLGVHHYLGISLWIIISVIIGIRLIYEFINNKICKILFLSLVLLLFIINFSTTFIFRGKSMNFISQNNKYYKLTYNNFNELKRLINDLDELVVEDKDNNVKFSVISESGYLSDNLVDLLGDVNISDNIIYTNHIDSRDDITLNALLTEFVVVTDPAQTGSSQKGQHVISIPNNLILNGDELGTSYENYKGPYNLDGNVKAYIYRKIDNISIENSEKYFNEMFKYNTKWKNEYDEFTKRLLSSDVKLGSIFGAFKKFDYKKTLIIYPGYSDTILNVPVENINKILKLKFYMKKENGKADVKVIVKQDDEIIYDNLISTLKKDELSIDLNDTNNLEVIINSGEQLENDYLYVDYKLIS